MKLYVDTNGKKVTVTKDPIAKTDGQSWTTTAVRSSPSLRLAKSRT
jgi:hypothetical protein